MIHERARALTAPLEPIALSVLNERASLQNRVDRKYIVPWAAFEQLVGELSESLLVLEIDGHRVFTYDTVYFDTPSLRAYRDHLQQRRKRFKCRSRRYVENDQYAFEVKLKGLRGMTVKRALLSDRAWHGTMHTRARAFLDQCLLEEYGHVLPDELVPTLRTTYRRMTFALRDAPERLTCDFHFAANDLPFDPRRSPLAMLAGDHVIVEHKAAGAGSAARLALRRLGTRPVSCSKYCLGIALTHPEVASNDLRPLLRKHFASCGDRAAAA